MTVEQMRIDISSVYSSVHWKDRVKRMTDEQVIAIYYDFVNRGKFDRKPIDIPKPEYKVNDPPKCKQISIWDLIPG